MHFELDDHGALHGQLQRALRLAILGGRLRTGERLPATRELAASLGVSRNTVLTAYEQLLAEGYVEARTGSGTYVADLRAAAPVRERAAPAARALRLSRFGAEAMRLRAHRPPGPQRRRKGLRYNLEYGLPLVVPALQSAWRRALSRAADNTSFDYPPADGLPGLREAIAGYLGRRRGIAASAEDVIVVGGTQQGLDLCVRVLCERGDRVLIEDPHYQGLRQVLLAQGAKVRAVAVDDDGVNPVALTQSRARLIAVTPSHQFPTGAVMPLARRLALLDWARRRDAWIVEDDYDGEFRYDARPVPALKSLDVDGRVLYVGSFSKVMFPALRLGYLVVPERMREAMRAAKWLCDRGCPAIEQNALAALIAAGVFERTLRRTGRLLAERRAALLRALERHCAGFITVRGGHAGMHLCAWLTRHKVKQEMDIVARAERVDLGVYPVSPYFAGKPRRAGLLLGYSGLRPAELDEAARRLGQILRALPPAR
jgi:GntR family transcriptional regulator/MocR family aminotransferase